MKHLEFRDAANVVAFGRRKVRPRACIAERKQHVRAFLVETLEDLGFVVHAYDHSGELADALDARQIPDLVVLGIAADSHETSKALRSLAALSFGGKVLLLGPLGLPAVTAMEIVATELGIALLPTLSTPISEADLRGSVAMLAPGHEPDDPPIHLSEAVRNGWLELWYQPEIAVRSLVIDQAEALVRIRHPNWGVVPATYFIPDDGDPHLRALSEFVIDRAIDDWRYLSSQSGATRIAINLPIAFFQDPVAVTDLCRRIPDDPAFEGLIVEVNGTELARNLDLAREAARLLRFHNIALAIDDLGAEWPLFAGLHEFPFVEVKVDRKFVTGCANDRLKRTVCRHILDLADGYGARTVAEGVETRADFLTVRDLGFDKAQGFFFARPSTAKRFARTVLGRPVQMPS